MIDLICARTGLDRYQAYALSSLAADLRITQVVNGAKGVHVMLEKRYLTRGDSHTSGFKTRDRQLASLLSGAAIFADFLALAFALLPCTGMIGSSTKFSRPPPRWIVVLPP